MKQTSQNIALFTVPAVKTSKKLFHSFGMYVFSDNIESNFKEEIYSQATHIGLGERYICQGDEGNTSKYIHISHLAEIVEIGSLEIDFSGEKITNIKNNSLQSIPQTTLLNFMQSFIENSIYCKDNWELAHSTERKWKCICVNPENIISISENILYPSKSLVSFPLNLDDNNNYIPSKELINTLKISEDVYLDKKNQCLLIKNISDTLKKGETILANNLKKVPLGENNSEFYAHLLEKIQAFPQGFFLKDFIEFANIKETDYAEKKKAFSRANFSDYLDFNISISARGFVTKTEKK